MYPVKSVYPVALRCPNVLVFTFTSFKQCILLICILCVALRCVALSACTCFRLSSLVEAMHPVKSVHYAVLRCVALRCPNVPGTSKYDIFYYLCIHTSLKHSRMTTESSDARQNPGLIGRVRVVAPGDEHSNPCFVLLVTETNKQTKNKKVNMG